MNLKLHTSITSLKRVAIGLASVLLAICLSILPINLTASAVSVSDQTSNIVYSLPFPSPESFGEASRSIVMYNEVKNRFTMFVLCFSLSPYVSDPSSIEFQAMVFPNTNNYFNYVQFRASFNPVMHSWDVSQGTDVYNIAFCRLYRFNWTVGSSNYSVARINLSGKNAPQITYNPATGDSPTLTYTYGDSSLPYEWSMKHTVCYNGAWVNNVVGSNVSYSFTSSESGAILSVLNDMNGTVSFYLSEILDRLDSDEGYTLEQTTSNSDMSNYEQAEGALMNDNIDKLNNIEMPDLNSFNSGSQNNAFKFISSNIEFFSGMNGTGSVAKIATVLVVILGLGLASFIIGLSNRKKGG